MTHFSSREENVRVDVFRESGKWYDTFEMKWLYYRQREAAIQKAFYISLFDSLAGCNERGPFIRYSGLVAVCLDPYHENSFPQMWRIPEFKDFLLVVSNDFPKKAVEITSREASKAGHCPDCWKRLDSCSCRDRDRY